MRVKNVAKRTMLRKKNVVKKTFANTIAHNFEEKKLVAPKPILNNIINAM